MGRSFPAAGSLAALMFVPGCGCFSSDARDKERCVGIVATGALVSAAHVLLVGQALKAPSVRERRIAGIKTVARIGSERTGIHVFAVGVDAEGRLEFADTAGNTAKGKTLACPPGRPLRAREFSFGADPRRSALYVLLFGNEARFERLSLGEVKVSAPWTSEERTCAIPFPEGGETREARELTVIPCGAPLRAVLVVAEAGARSTGVDVFEVVFSSAGGEQP